VANTDCPGADLVAAERIIQMGLGGHAGLGAGSQPEVGRAAAEEVLDEIRDQLSGATWPSSPAGMGGGTGTGAGSGHRPRGARPRAS
jgi:cell division protein FtsZ